MRKLLASLVLLPALALAQAPAPPSDGEAPRLPRPYRPPGAFPRPGMAQPPGAQPQPGAPPPPGAQPPPGAPPPPGAQPPPGALPPPGAQPPPGAPPQRPGRTGAAETLKPEAKCSPLQGRFMLTFNKADVVDILEQASRWTCRNFVYTEDIARGKITLLSKTPVTADEAYAAFLVALNTNNIAIYATGKYYKLIRTADAKKAPIPLYTDADSGTPANEQPITKVIRLSFSDADQMRGIVSNFVSPQGADIVAIPPDMLIITDIGLNIRRIERILEAVDRTGAGDLVRLVQVRYAAAKDIADKVNQIFQVQQGRTGAKRTLVSGQPGAARPGQPSPVPGAPPAAAVPAPGPGGPVEISVSKIIPDDRTNKLIIIADEKSFQRILDLIDQLDVPTSGEGGIHVVFLRNANAEEMAQTLSALAQGQARGRTPGSPAAPGVPGGFAPAAVTPPGQAAPARPSTAPAAGAETAELFAGEVKITADKAQNALLVQASGSDFNAVQRLVEKLDRPRRQVFVEAVILEVNLRNENQFGVGAHGAIPYKYKGKDAIIPIASEPGRVSSLGVTNILAAAGLGGFLTGFVGPASTEAAALGLNLPTLGLVIQALQSSSDVNVLSTPHLVATDNEESEIVVGQNVPFQAGYTPAGLQSLLGAAGTAAATTTANLGGLSSLVAPIQRQPVELRLKIKPQINEGGNVRLHIEEQTEEIASNDPVLGPTTSKRSVKTQIVARDQSTIVIGGLIQERTVRSVKKIPFLGSLPLLGWLFRDTVATKSKTNLLLFLTPYIIRDEADYRRIYEKKRKEQQDFVEQFYGRQPGFEVDIDFSRKAGPYARMRAGVVEESSKLENGGRGKAGERVTAPFGGEPVPTPAPPVRRRAPGDGSLPEEGTPVDKLEVQPEVPPPGGLPPAVPPAVPPTVPPGEPATPAPQEQPPAPPQGPPPVRRE